MFKRHRMKYRGVNYGLKKLEPSDPEKWEWKIYPKKEMGNVVRGEVIGTRDEAEAACKKEIDA
jgi:hypothetical protein